MLLNRRLLAFLCIGLAVLGIGPIARTGATPKSASSTRAQLPPIAGCVSLHGWSAEWSPSFVDPDYEVSDSYQCHGYRMHINVVQYVEQRQGKEAVGEFNSVVPRSWRNVTTRRRQVVSDDLEVDEYSIEKPTARLTVWNWYAVGVRPATSEFAVKAFEAFDALTFSPRATTNFTVAIEGDPGIGAADALKKAAFDIWTWFKTETRTSA